MKNKISLGTANFNSNYGINRNNLNLKNKDIKKILIFAEKNQIRSIDTATNYAGVEKKLGQFKLKKFKISSKLKAISKSVNNIENIILSEIQASLKRLKIKKLEILYLHNSKDLIDKKKKFKVYEALKKAKKLNLIKKIGISVYSKNDLIKIINQFKIEAVQLPYSLIDRRFEKIFLLLKKKNISIQVRSIFLQGLLLQNFNEMPKYFLKFKEIKQFEEWTKKNKISKLEASINFVKNSKYINSIVIGFNNIFQLKQITQCFNKKKFFYPKKIHSKDINLIDPRKWRVN